MEKNINDFSFGLFFWQSILLISTVLLIYCLIDILKNSFNGNDKVIWVLVILFVPIVGSLLYLFIGRKQKLELN